MASKKKLLQAAAGSAGGEVLDIDDVFSTYLYTGTGSALTINNGLDLSGEGGLVWTKRRDLAGNGHMLVDTARGGSSFLKSHTTDVANTSYTLINSFNSNGYTLSTNGWVNGSGDSVCSWTFRKAPKFFDVVTYTGDDSGNVVKSHSLGSTPGMIIIKNLSSNTGWDVFHRSTTNGLGTGRLFLHLTNAEDNTSTQFLTADSSSITLTHSIVKTGGENYVAYLFAHNNSDGGFGPDSDQDVIKCGSFTTDGSSDATIDLGFEPQWVLFKRTDSSTSGAWNIFDSMRGMQGDFISQGAVLEANKADAEQTGQNLIAVTPTGFKIDNYGANRDFIYMAIRRGPLAEPENATDVFAISTGAGTDAPLWTSNFPIDMAMNRDVSSAVDTNIVSRLTGTNRLETNTTDAEVSSNASKMDYMDGYHEGTLNLPTYYSWMWKRAPSYFDVVAYTGTGSNRTISHNLGAVPEMIWVKRRNTINNWKTFHSSLGGTKSMELNTTVAAETNGSALWNSTAPTASVFSLGTASDVNGSGSTYIAYLFATVAGVSKVGSFSHTSGQTQNIDCGFSSGARFVLVKQYGGTGNWFVYDTARGIVAGNDPRLQLNTTAAENTANDDIDPLSSGFTLTTNFSGGDYIFYAIA